jgi:hypothetical protein
MGKGASGYLKLVFLGEKWGGDRCTGGWFGLEGRARGSREEGRDWILDVDQCFVSCSGRALRLGKRGMEV